MPVGGNRGEADPGEGQEVPPSFFECNELAEFAVENAAECSSIHRRSASMVSRTTLAVWYLAAVSVTLASASFAQQAPYDVSPAANPPYYRVRYEASARPGELKFAVRYTIWIPSDVKTLRGVIVHQHGCGEGSCNLLLHPDRVAAAWLRSGVPLFKPIPERPTIKAYTLPEAPLQVPVSAIWARRKA
jgi:hypothetical protein